MITVGVRVRVGGGVKVRVTVMDRINCNTL